MDADPRLDDARRRVKAPALSLTVFAAVSAAHNVWGLFGGGVDAETFDATAPNVLGPDFPFAALRPFVIGLSAIGLAVSLFCLWASLRMRALRSWGAALCAHVLLMIPFFSGCLCCFSVPLGVWGFVVLFRDDVRQAFKSALPAPQPV